ncbi:MAG: TetR/AcrR family transcriptional regulator [Gammaproteobacteria bacterium]|jgi:AcrR family transcriptional regulator
MTWKQHAGKRQRRSYHHGNLREALIEAALTLIARKGPEGFTFAEAAREAGVSAAAPYRHFRDREALVLEVARRGFEQFGAALERGWDGGQPDPLVALKRVGVAYLEFARTEAPLFSAMFESGISVAADRELKATSDAAFDVVRRAAEHVCAGLDPVGRPPASMIALHVWSLSHGIACLFARGDQARRPLPMLAEDLLEAGVLVYLDGLGVRR